MSKQCHACGEQISDVAKICKFCSSNQRKPIYIANAFVGLGTLVVSVMALFVSFAALYFSRVIDPPSPRLFVQVDRFNDTGFSFFVANLGQLPTAIRDFDLKISLDQGEGTHEVVAGFSVPLSNVPPGENRLLQIDYSSFQPEYTSWTASKDLRQPFNLQFLYMAAKLGSNLHCEVEVYFTSQRYFPNNMDGAKGSVNGICTEAMKWFAENVGPLKIDDNLE